MKALQLDYEKASQFENEMVLQLVEEKAWQLGLPKAWQLEEASHVHTRSRSLGKHPSLRSDSNDE